MDIETRMALVRRVGEEIVTEEELKHIFESNQHPVAYDGFEPSGCLHVAQGLMRAINVNRMLKAGCTFKMLVADWHGWANNKMGGDFEKIQTTGKYMIEVWRAAGMDTEKIDFVWVSDMIKDIDYWKKVMQVARNTTVNRIMRCCQIMGRCEKEVQHASQILYPCMQCADIFHLGVDICQLGMDQRKVNMLAREVGPKLFGRVPVVVSHHMLMGLAQPPRTSSGGVERVIQMKMSKSNPNSAIFMTDSTAEIKAKIAKAYCPEKVVQENPVMEYCKYIIFAHEKFREFKIDRPAKFGGPLSFADYQELEKTYMESGLHPMDLKNAVAAELDGMIEPVRKHFFAGSARKLLEQVESFRAVK
jgi:tyrosyl-tRNA synthetase